MQLEEGLSGSPRLEVEVDIIEQNMVSTSQPNGNSPIGNHKNWKHHVWLPFNIFHFRFRLFALPHRIGK